MNEVDFLNSRLTFALVCTGSYEGIQKFKQLIAESDGVTFVYQKTSADRLYITDKPSSDRGTDE